MTKKEKIMLEAGSIMADIKVQMIEAIKPGVSSMDIEDLVVRLIHQNKCKVSFSTVSGYDFATCINLNSGMVHGIPRKDIIFKPGDVVTVDTGLLLHHHHVDNAVTVQIDPKDEKTTRFLDTGKQALKAAIKQARPGNSIYDISLALESTIESAGYSVSRDLTGHGIGRQLHETPNIPCYSDSAYKKVKITSNQTLAIEIMYAMGDSKLKIDEDGWKYSTVDGSLSGMFEETVFIGQDKTTPVTAIDPNFYLS